MSELINYIMAKFVEMEKNKHQGPNVRREVGSINLINKFNVEPEKVAQFLHDWKMIPLNLIDNQDYF